MELDPAIALAAVFTAGGAAIWGPTIQGIIQMLKGVGVKALDGHEKLACLILSALVVAAAFAAGMQEDPPSRSLSVVEIILALLSTYTLTRMSMAAYDDFVGKE